MPDHDTTTDSEAALRFGFAAQVARAELSRERQERRDLFKRFARKRGEEQPAEMD